MSVNPIRPGNNRANEIKSTKGDLKRSVTLFDIDYAMMSYLEDTVLPTLKDANGVGVKIPVIYGNSERWKSRSSSVRLRRALSFTGAGARITIMIAPAILTLL